VCVQLFPRRSFLSLSFCVFYFSVSHSVELLYILCRAQDVKGFGSVFVKNTALLGLRILVDRLFFSKSLELAELFALLCSIVVEIEGSFMKILGSKN